MILSKTVKINIKKKGGNCKNDSIITPPDTLGICGTCEIDVIYVGYIFTAKIHNYLIESIFTVRFLS